MPRAVNKLAPDPVDLVGTLSGKVPASGNCTRDLAGSLKGPGGKGRELGEFRQGDKVNLEESLSPPLSAVPENPDEQVWAVNRCDAVLGVGKYLGRIRASSRGDAERQALEKFGASILVSLAGGRARRDRESYHHRTRRTR